MSIEILKELGKPFKIYAEVLEDSAMKQFVDAMQLDTVVQGALMPDAHTGYSLPIGGVVATKNMVYPAFVGYDIGCGMCALPLEGVNVDLLRKKRSEVHAQILRDIPTGKIHHKVDQVWEVADDFDRTSMANEEFVRSGLRQIGTLGGGNHFIEVGEDTEGKAWIVIHSGSRNFGHRIATHYMKLASGDGKAREGGFGLATNSKEGEDYIKDLRFALEFALANREAMIRKIEKAIRKIAGGSGQWDALINRNHNHAEYKMIPLQGSPDHAQGVWIHRKGATHAEEGMMGVIPGNMRDGSFIVRGKGNPESMSSSSHGAGRVMSRKQASESISMADFKKTMEESGVFATVTKGTLDESPMVYKDIFAVMRLQEDLVDVVTHVKPILNVKADEKPKDWKQKKKELNEKRTQSSPFMGR